MVGLIILGARKRGKDQTDAVYPERCGPDPQIVGSRSAPGKPWDSPTLAEPAAGGHLYFASHHADGPGPARPWYCGQRLVLSRHAEIRFWQQANSLIQGEKFYEGFRTAKMFWWFNQHAPVQWSATPKPYYGCDGSKVFGILDQTGCDLVRKLGPFPFHAFWGPKAGLPSSDWIARASAEVIRQQKPEMTLVYLPHLDYDYQRLTEHDPARVAEVDRCAGLVIDAAEDVGAKVIAVSEYGLVPVNQPVSLNVHLRRLVG